MEAKCKFCKKPLRDTKDDWDMREAHKNCWKTNERVYGLINYLKNAKYIPANYQSSIHLLQI